MNFLFILREMSSFLLLFKESLQKPKAINKITFIVNNWLTNDFFVSKLPPVALSF